MIFGFSDGCETTLSVLRNDVRRPEEISFIPGWKNGIL